MAISGMVSHMRKGLLMVSQKNVAATIYRETGDGKTGVIYVPVYWGAIMTVVRAIPEKIAKL